MQTLDLTNITTYPIAQRQNLVHLGDLVSPEAPMPDFDSKSCLASPMRLLRRVAQNVPSSG